MFTLVLKEEGYVQMDYDNFLTKTSSNFLNG